MCVKKDKEIPIVNLKFPFFSATVSLKDGNISSMFLKQEQTLFKDLRRQDIERKNDETKKE